jgi:homoserine O-acetyltransferase
MVALSFAERFPDRLGRLAVISAPAVPHPMATALRELQRRVVAIGLQHHDGDAALAVARGMAMLTYRTPVEFAGRFAGGLKDQRSLADTEPGQYLKARGAAFRAVMSPERFLSLSASIDRHHVNPSAISAPTLLIGAWSDQLVPPCQMQSLAKALPQAHGLHLRESLFGHDMFLKEADFVSAILRAFLED